MLDVNFNRRSVGNTLMTEATETLLKRKRKDSSGNSACGVYNQPFKIPWQAVICVATAANTNFGQIQLPVPAAVPVEYCLHHASSVSLHCCVQPFTRGTAPGAETAGGNRKGTTL